MNTQQVFEAFNTLRVLVIGDVMLDAYVWGKVERISPEAPVPVVTVEKKEYRLGGAGNVLLNIQSLGAEAMICTVVGNDATGNLLESELRDRKLNCEGLLRSDARITTIKERIIAGSQQVVRIDNETDLPISEEERRRLILKAKELIPSSSVVIFEDYDKGVLTPEAIAEITAYANEHEVPTVVDPKKRNFLAYQNVTLFKPNLKELREGLKVDFDSNQPKELEAVVSQLKSVLNAQGALITLSERGVFVDFQDEVHHLPAHIRTIADVSGAGDTVISIAACCLALGLPPRAIAGISNLGGGLVCEMVGVVPINKAVLEKEVLKEGLI